MWPIGRKLLCPPCLKLCFHWLLFQTMSCRSAYQRLCVVWLPGRTERREPIAGSPAVTSAAPSVTSETETSRWWVTDLSVWTPVSLPVCLSACLSLYLSVSLTFLSLSPGLSPFPQLCQLLPWRLEEVMNLTEPECNKTNVKMLHCGDLSLRCVCQGVHLPLSPSVSWLHWGKTFNPLISAVTRRHIYFLFSSSAAVSSKRRQIGWVLDRFQPQLRMCELLHRWAWGNTLYYCSTTSVLLQYYCSTEH